MLKSRGPAACAPVRAPAPSRQTWRLYYYRDQFGNFGDDLNPWLWSRLLPGRFSPDAATAFVGIGTILNANLPDGPKVIVGSGVGYGAAPTPDPMWDVRFVRGPHSAAALGLPTSMAIADPAYLIRTLVPPALRRDGVVFIPHHVSALQADWRQVAARAGVRYVDPSGPLETVIDAIRSANLVVSCAMHGCILADALRTPWIRVKPYAHLNDFKFADWGASMDLDPHAYPLPALKDDSALTLRRRAMLTMQAWRQQRRPVRVNWRTLPLPAVVSSSTDVDAAVAALVAFRSSGAHATLSSDRLLHDRVSQLTDVVGQLRGTPDRVAVVLRPFSTSGCGLSQVG